MVYRDTRDPRIEQLKQLIATEPDVRAERASTRAEHDAIQEQADAIAVELARGEGVLSRLLGSDREKRQTEHAELARQLEELAAKERVLDERMSEVQSAREELAQREAALLHAMKSAPGPIGDELRALDRELEELTTNIANLEPVVSTAERTETVSIILLKLKAELDEKGGIGMGVLETFADGLSPRPYRVRVVNELPLVEGRLADLRAAIDGLFSLDVRWRGDLELNRLRRGLDRALTVEDGIVEVAHTVTAIVSKLGLALRRFGTQREQLVARQRELVRVL